MQNLFGVNLLLLFLILVSCIISIFSSHTDLNNTQWLHSVTNLGNSKLLHTAPLNSDMQRGSRMSSRKRFFQDLENEGTSVASETLIERTYASGSTSNENENTTVRDELENSFSFGQAHYQKDKQGVIIEYKDHGDNTFQCVHCHAYYWCDEKNTRRIYTGCCQQGQAEVLSGLVYKLRNSPPDRYACLVAEPAPMDTSKSQELVGVVDVTASRDWSVLEYLPPDADEFLYVSGIAVLKSFRRKKVAIVLLKACDMLSVEWGFRYLALRAYEDDFGARELYANAGYKVVSGDPPWMSTWIGRKRRVLMIKQSVPTR